MKRLQNLNVSTNMFTKLDNHKMVVKRIISQQTYTCKI